MKGGAGNEVIPRNYVYIRYCGSKVYIISGYHFKKKTSWVWGCQKCHILEWIRAGFRYKQVLWEVWVMGHNFWRKYMKLTNKP